MASDADRVHRYRAAAEALGPSHPVARAMHARSILRRQLAATTACAALAAGVAIAEWSVPAAAFLSAALVVDAWVGTGLALATVTLRERARDMIADGYGDLEVAELAAERERLASARHRTSLARSLARALYAAEHWPELALASRPPPPVRNLAAYAEATAEVADLVCNPATSVRAVALLDRLLCGGYGATLYTGPPDELGSELARIRYLLTADVQASSATRSSSATPSGRPARTHSQ